MGRRTGIISTILLAVAAALTATAAAAASEPPGTWRLDLHHTGGLGQEIFSLDRVVVEPLPWAGHPAGRIDDSGAGKYRFRVLDGSGSVLYSRGFASIYGEWETTAEAGERHRTFHESLRFPAPAGPVQVAVDERGADQGVREVWRTTVDPEDMFVDTAAPRRQEVVEIEVHGAPRDKVDLLFVGDGYTEAECAGEGGFGDDARRLAAVLFAHQPFTARRDDFNLWGVCPPSPRSGVSRPSTGVHVASPVGATYDAFGSERYVLTFDNRALREVAAWAPYEFLVILVNSDVYGGGGIFNLYATVAADNDWADYLFIHEFAHHFAGLADEYYTSPVAYEPPAEVVEPWEANATALPAGPEGLKWGDLVAGGVPVPTPWPRQRFEEHARQIQQERQKIRAEDRPESEMSALFRRQQAFESELLGGAEHSGAVGAFQGANYDAEVFYRPQVDCVMFSRNEVPFCAVCRRALEAVIDRYAPPAAP